MSQGKLNGWGFSINDQTWYFGEFINNTISIGLRIHSIWKYWGQFLSGSCHGKGILTRTDAGWVYKGDFTLGVFQGKGTMTWSDGFFYQGEWHHNQPTDQERSIHPSLRDCIQKSVCTSQFTGKSESFGQYLSVGGDGKTYCDSCVKSCQEETLNWRWFVYCAVCSCAKRSDCRSFREEDSPTFKRQKIS